MPVHPRTGCLTCRGKRVGRSRSPPSAGRESIPAFRQPGRGGASRSSRAALSTWARQAALAESATRQGNLATLKWLSWCLFLKASSVQVFWNPSSHMDEEWQSLDLVLLLHLFYWRAFPYTRILHLFNWQKITYSLQWFDVKSAFICSYTHSYKSLGVWSQTKYLQLMCRFGQFVLNLCNSCCVSL